MSYIKNKKTNISIGATLPATATLAAAVTAADTSFMCLIETMNGIDFTRGTTVNPSVYCQSDTAFQTSDTDDLVVSNFTIEGMIDDDAAEGYAEVAALCETMIKADTRGTLVITEPNGTDKLWFEMKVVKVAKLRGGAQDKQKFAFEFIPMTMPVDA